MEKQPQVGKSGDIETGKPQLYPNMTENPELRWAFIRKVYVILTIQLFLTVGIVATIVFVHPIPRFFESSKVGFGVFVVLLILPIIFIWLLYHYHRSYPVNFVLLGIFTVLISFSVGLSCAFVTGKVVLEAAILASVVVVSLTVYTFWAGRQGHDFNFLGPFLFAALTMILVFALIQLFFPLGKISSMIYGGVATVLFCAYIVYDTDRLIKRCAYDQYIWAAVSLYLDGVNLFLSLLTFFRAAN